MRLSLFAVILLAVFIRPVELQDCGGVLNVERGIITSPSYPNYYPSNKICIWEIVAPPHHRIILNFTHFDVEKGAYCTHDRVYVSTRKSTDEEWKKHGKYCGSVLPPVLSSEGNALRIKFVSDGSMQRKGFAAVFYTEEDECASNNGGCQQICHSSVGSYQCSCQNGFTLHPNGHDCKEDACGGVLNVARGVIRSPSYPDFYPSNKICIWEIVAPPHHRIILNFTHFELENGTICHDRVDVSTRESPDEEWKKQGTYCGSGLPPVLTTEGNALRIKFSSDGSHQKKGFAALFFTDSLKCSKFDDEDFVIFYDGDQTVNSSALFFCKDMNKILEGSSIVTCLPNGNWSDDPPKCKSSPIVKCPKFDDMDLFILYDNGQVVNSIALFFCKDKRKKLHGKSLATCLPSGQWSSDPPECKIACPWIEEFEGMKVFYTKNFDVGSFAAFHCSYPRTRSGVVWTTCQANGEWTDPPPKCLNISGCSLPKTENSGLIIDPEKEAYLVGESVTLSCSPGYVLNSEIVRLTCMGTSWSENVPECRKE